MELIIALYAVKPDNYLGPTRFYPLIKLAEAGLAKRKFARRA